MVLMGMIYEDVMMRIRYNKTEEQLEIIWHDGLLQDLLLDPESNVFIFLVRYQQMILQQLLRRSVRPISQVHCSIGLW